MKITSYVELTQAQEKTIKALETVVVRAVLTRPVVVATVRTSLAQEVKLTIDADGVITSTEVQDECL